jgi:acetylornithine aminotransferase
MAYRYGVNKAIQDPIIITLENSYHGRTLAALKASGSKQLHQEKLALGLTNVWQTIISIPLNDIDILQSTIHRYHERVVAILIEPILGDGGIRVCSDEFLQTIRSLCNKYDCLMMADEIQTGLCRTGAWSACEASGIQPDVLVLAKALGNGFPIGAYLANTKAQCLLDGYHGSTFAGNPLGCAVALCVLEILQAENINQGVQKKGDYLKSQLHARLSKNPMIRSIRGKGLMLGIELDHPCVEILHTALRYKLLFDIVDTHTLRLLPPLTIQDTEIDELIKRLAITIEEYTLTRYTYPK